MHNYFICNVAVTPKMPMAWPMLNSNTGTHHKSCFYEHLHAADMISDDDDDDDDDDYDAGANGYAEQAVFFIDGENA